MMTKKIDFISLIISIANALFLSIMVVVMWRYILTNKLTLANENELIYKMCCVLVLGGFMSYLLYILYQLMLQYIKLHQEEAEKQHEQTQLLISTGFNSNQELISAIEELQNQLSASTSIAQDKEKLTAKINNAIKFLGNNNELQEKIKEFEKVLSKFKELSTATTSNNPNKNEESNTSEG